MNNVLNETLVIDEQGNSNGFLNNSFEVVLVSACEIPDVLNLDPEIKNRITMITNCGRSDESTPNWVKIAFTVSISAGPRDWLISCN
jgi:hypothetical protein